MYLRFLSNDKLNITSTLRQDQHRALVAKNGLYAFVLLNKDGKVLLSKLVDANDISMPNRENWQLPWFKIFDDFDYQPDKEDVTTNEI